MRCFSSMKCELQTSEKHNFDKETIEAEISAFLGINILMGIHKLPSMKDYWSVEEGLGNILIQNTMTRSRFLEILQNLHFANNLQDLPPNTGSIFEFSLIF